MKEIRYKVYFDLDSSCDPEMAVYEDYKDIIDEESFNDEDFWLNQEEVALEDCHRVLNLKKIYNEGHNSLGKLVCYTVLNAIELEDLRFRCFLLREPPDSDHVPITPFYDASNFIIENNGLPLLADDLTANIKGPSLSLEDEGLINNIRGPTNDPDYIITSCSPCPKLKLPDTFAARPELFCSIPREGLDKLIQITDARKLLITCPFLEDSLKKGKG